MRTGMCHETTEEYGNNTAVHEAGLTASRIPHYRYTAESCELQKDVVNLSFPAKEKMAFVHRKWTQARERISTHVLRYGIRVGLLVLLANFDRVV